MKGMNAQIVKSSNAMKGRKYKIKALTKNIYNENFIVFLYLKIKNHRLFISVFIIVNQKI